MYYINSANKTLKTLNCIFNVILNVFKLIVSSHTVHNRNLLFYFNLHCTRSITKKCRMRTIGLEEKYSNQGAHVLGCCSLGLVSVLLST